MRLWLHDPLTTQDPQARGQLKRCQEHTFWTRTVAGFRLGGMQIDLEQARAHSVCRVHGNSRALVWVMKRHPTTTPFLAAALNGVVLASVGFGASSGFVPQATVMLLDAADRLAPDEAPVVASARLTEARKRVTPILTPALSPLAAERAAEFTRRARAVIEARQLERARQLGRMDAFAVAADRVLARQATWNYGDGS